MKLLRSLIQALCFTQLRSLWISIACGIVLMMPGFLLGMMVGVQGGAPLGAAWGARFAGRLGSKIGYYGVPIVVILFFLGVFFIIGINIGNLIGWLLSKLIGSLISKSR